MTRPWFSYARSLAVAGSGVLELGRPGERREWNGQILAPPAGPDTGSSTGAPRGAGGRP